MPWVAHVTGVNGMLLRQHMCASIELASYTKILVFALVETRVEVHLFNKSHVPKMTSLLTG